MRASTKFQNLSPGETESDNYTTTDLKHGASYRAGYIKIAEPGALTSVWCAADRQFDGIGGVPCEDCDIAPLVLADSEGLGVRPYTINREYADQL